MTGRLGPETRSRKKTGSESDSSLVNQGQEDDSQDPWIIPKKQKDKIKRRVGKSKGQSTNSSPSITKYMHTSASIADSDIDTCEDLNKSFIQRKHDSGSQELRNRSKSGKVYSTSLTIQTTEPESVHSNTSAPCQGRDNKNKQTVTSKSSSKSSLDRVSEMDQSKSEQHLIAKTTSTAISTCAATTTSITTAVAGLTSVTTVCTSKVSVHTTPSKSSLKETDHMMNSAFTPYTVLLLTPAVFFSLQHTLHPRHQWERQ